MRIVWRAALAAALWVSVWGGGARAATDIDLYFPVPVQGRLVVEIRKLIDAFNKGHPQINVTAVYAGSYDATNLKTQAAIKAGHPPAAVIMSANFVRSYQINHEIVLLDPLIEKDGLTPKRFMGEFWPALADNATVGGKVYGVPFQNSTPLLYYSVDAFKQAGLDPNKPPVTWKQFIADAQKLTMVKNGSVQRYGFEMPGTYDYLGWIVSGLAMSNGGQYYNHDYAGEVYYDQPSTLGAVMLLDEMVNKLHVMPPGVTNASAVSSAFFTGHTAMMVLSTGALSFIRSNMKAPFKVAFMPYNVRPAAPIGGASLIIPAGNSPARVAAAWTLIKWLVSPKIAGEWSRFTGYFAPRIAAYQLPAMQDYLAKNPDAKVALAQLKNAVPWFDTFETVAVRKAMENQVQAVLSGRTTPEKAVKAAQAAADTLMKPYVEKTALAIPH
ncbi:MAG: ABC transporter substrate-binding protein [Rhodospirillales bacterium]|nr:ABC transporter substrate-binding protein [Rhodospirillales bacterium]